jgi:HD-like signal output (HDOD) protein
MPTRPGRETHLVGLPGGADAEPEAPQDPRAAEFERRILACPSLPTIPAVALQVLSLCRSEDVDLSKIADAIATDPALTGRVLRAVNAAAYSSRGKVTTIHRAVSFLGANAVIAIALSFSLLKERRTDNTHGFDRAAFWRRAMFSALAGRTLAQVTAPSIDAEEAFVGALLQDIGMLALAEVFHEKYGALTAHAGGDHDALVDLEKDVWGADHAHASALLVRSWRLPGPLERAIASSHDGAPPAGASPKEAQLMRCVALSGRIADAWTAPSGLDTALALEASRVRVGVSAPVMEAVLARIAVAVPDTMAEFEIDLGGEARVEEVMREAKRLLDRRDLKRPAEQAVLQGDRELPDTPMEIAFAYAQAQGEPLALLMVSSSAPPSIHAHPDLVTLAQSCVRPIDLVDDDGHGGVLLLLPDTTDHGARAVAETILHRNAGLRHALHIGVAASLPASPAPTLEALQAAAASALASASARGGGHLEVAPPHLVVAAGKSSA